MTDEQKLEALVWRAVEGGHNPTNFAWISEDHRALLDYWFTADNYKAVIFNHDFARALFGAASEKPAEQDWPFSWMWEQYLAMAVISEDPITYFYEQVFKDA